MERLWAPWRIQYIESLTNQDKTCIFCAKASQREDDDNFLLYRGKTVFLLLNTFPYTNGHLLVAPYRHTADLTSLTAEESRELLAVATLGVKILSKALNPDGFNLGMNLGRPAGAGITDHLHLHIVPRWSGDSNFMTVCGNTKVIPEALPATLQKLRAALAALEQENG